MAQQQCLLQHTRQATRRITRAYDEALRPLGLRATQFTILAAAEAAPEGANLSAMAEALGMDRTTLSRNLGPLHARGLLRFDDDRNVGRARTVRLTAAGAALLAEALVPWQEVQDRIALSLEAERIGAYRELIAAVAEASGG